MTERGTHDELIAANGTYKALYSLQFRSGATVTPQGKSLETNDDYKLTCEYTADRQ